MLNNEVHLTANGIMQRMFCAYRTSSKARKKNVLVSQAFKKKIPCGQAAFFKFFIL